MGITAWVTVLHFLLTVANPGLLWPPVGSRGTLSLSWQQAGFQKPLGSSGADGLLDGKKMQVFQSRRPSPCQSQRAALVFVVGFVYFELNVEFTSCFFSSTPTAHISGGGGRGGGNLLVVQTTHV